MKKILTSAICIMSVCSVVKAEPYIGLNLLYDNLQLDKSFGAAISDIAYMLGTDLGEYKSKDLYPEHSFGISVNAGYNFFEYWGLEAYFQYNLKNSVDEHFSGEKIWDAESNFISGGLDIIGYLPLNTNRSLHLIGTIGAGYYRFETDTKIFPEEDFLSTKIKKHEKHLAARIGLGVQYDINKELSVRALGRYITWKSDEPYSMNTVLDGYDMAPIDGIFEITTGIQYKF